MKKVYSILLVGGIGLAFASSLSKVGVEIKAEGEVATSSLIATDFANCWDGSSSFTEEGLLVTVPGADTKGGAAWNSRTYFPNQGSADKFGKTFSLNNNDSISIDFSIGLYTSDGNPISKSVNDNDFDLYVVNGETIFGILRFWIDTSNPTGDALAWELLDSGYGSKVQCGESAWVKGNATLESNIHVEFSKDKYFSAYVGVEGQDEPELVQLDDNAGTFAKYIGPKLTSADNIQFFIGGDNGFTKETQILIKAINGQSLASTNGMISDNVGPRFDHALVSSTINLDQDYVIPTEAFDLLSDEITYEVSVNGGDKVSGKTLHPTAEGELTAVLYATDEFGNESSKEYSFTVVESIDKPEITSLPTIVNQELDYFSSLVIDMPEFVDNTGNTEVVLKIMLGEDEVASLSPENNKFSLYVGKDFAAGQYSFVFELTNAGGTTVSEPILATLQLKDIASAQFVDAGDAIADYTDKGLRIRSGNAYKEVTYGLFDVKHGMDIKFMVEPTCSNGKANDVNYLNWIFQNVDNPDYKVMYRVWADFTGSDRPTNIYVYKPGAGFLDITDTGWISRNVDEVSNQYHMSFNMDETFVGERTGGLTRVDKAYDNLVEFFNECPSTKFWIKTEGSKLGAGSNESYEYTITELNGQSFASTNGELNEVNDAFLYVEDTPTSIAINKTLEAEVYAKDVLGDCDVEASIKKDGGSKTDITIENGMLSYTFEELGTYTLEIKAFGTNSKAIKVVREITCKTSTDPIELSLNGEYEAQADVGESLVIKEATGSANVTKIEISIIDSNATEHKVSAGDSYKFDKPGIYKIVYTAFDNAEPTPNTKKIEVIINVLDVVDPIVEFGSISASKLGDKSAINVTVSDDSDYDLTISITKPDGTKTNIQNGAEFLFEATGNYVIKAVAEDVYGNKTEVEKTVKISEKGASKKGCKGSLIGTSILVSTISFVAVLALAKRNKGE